jgi:alcohol dehydrogenase
MAPTATSGTWAGYIKAPINSICMKPNNLSFAEAGSLPLVGITALQALDDNQLQSGMHVLIIGGSGGVGHISVQLAKIRGAKVTAICSRRNVKFVEKLNADLVIAYDETDDILIDLNKAVNTLGKIDIVFDTVTSNETHDSKFSYEKTICDSPALFGAVRRYIKIGGSPSDWALAHFKRFLGIDLFPKDRELFWIRMSNSSEYLKMLCSYCESNTLKPVVALHVPFTEKDILEAFNQIRNRHMVGKIVIDVIPSENGKT